MFKLNLKIALRNIWKYKLTTSIKLIGLVVGLSTVVILVSYVLFELSYDQHHNNVSQIYRLQSIETKSQKIDIHLPSGLAKTMMDEIPEITNVTTLNSNAVEVKIGEHFFDKHLVSTENAFFNIFTAPLLVGDIKNVLKAPNTVVISEGFAKNAFPNENPLGKSITLANYPNNFQIVGIMKDFPMASHFKGDFLTSANFSQKLNWNSYSGTPQYVQLKEGTAPEIVEQKIKRLYQKYEFPKDLKIQLMPLAKIHLYSHTSNEMEANSDIKYVYIFSTVAFFILLIAIVNFVNLTIAASIKRGKEIGVKKVMGASSKQLIFQFLSESYLYFIFATILVLILTHDLIPLLGAKMGIDISLAQIINTKTILISLSIIVIAGFVAGLYPAIILSRLMPVKTLKGYTGHTTKGFGFKKILMVFQFAISAFLIVCTLVIYAQLKFIQNKDLGFDKEQVLVSKFNVLKHGFADFKADLSRKADVKSISLSSFNPGSSYGGSSSWTNDNDTTTYSADFIDADLNFINTLNIKVLKGRAFSAKYGSDLMNYFSEDKKLTSQEAANLSYQRPILLNEAAVKALHLTNPIDTVLSLSGLQGKVIGVVSDFNGMSLHQSVTPLAINLSLKSTAGYVYIKINSDNIYQTKAAIETIWKKYLPEQPSNFQFMDVHLEKLYQSEMRLGAIFISFAGIAIFLCCIGLFGMVYFELEQRTKEIAVRKILGASVKELLTLLNTGFIKVVIIANILIWPIAYFLMKEWLNDFHYRVELSYLPFLIAMGVCTLLTVLTVSLQAIKSVRKSPVVALKYE